MFRIQYDAPLGPVWMNANGNWTPFADMARTFESEEAARRQINAKILRHGMTARVVSA